MNTTDIIHIIGTAAFAVSGYLVGVRKRLDLLGVLIVALLTAIGGGMMRDVLVGRVPLVFTQHSAIITIALTLVAAWLFKLQNQRFFFAGRFARAGGFHHHRRASGADV